MSFEIERFDLAAAVVKWVVAVVSCVVIGLFVSAVVSFLAYGPRGFGRLWDAVKRGVVDLTRLSGRRIMAIARLAVHESFYRKAFYVFAVFIPLFMFAGWFLQADMMADKPAKPYISFVMFAIRWMLVLVAVLLACWGLPADIKDRSLHTVVTKPVRRSEVVIGRMLGYGFVTTIVLVVMSLIGFIWIVRTVPQRAQDQLISRVPVYASDIYYIDRSGERLPEGVVGGVNVGDIWDYRSYIEGQTNARAGWEFQNISEDTLARSDDGGEILKLEYKFEAFRTHKGTIDEGIHFRVTLINEETGLRVPWPPTGAGIPIQEFAVGTEEATIPIPRTLRVDRDGNGEPEEVDLLNDLVQDGRLLMEVHCEDSGQFIGVAQPDLFIRKVDRPFASGYFKSILAIWMLLLLIIMIGTAASCFLKGPVATFLTLGLFLLGGTGLRTFMMEQLHDFNTKGEVLGGGPLESTYRMVTQMNVQSELPDSALRGVIEFLDPPILEGLNVLKHVIPNFNYFDSTKYVANGFDVPWATIDAALLPGIATTLGYLIPCIVLGYFSLQVRELEAK
jgi:ABC-type transport system involved in multi-copper enzyme maturation permease subunit